MTERFQKPDYDPWGTLATATGENNQRRLHNIVDVYDALRALIYWGEARGKLTHLGDSKTVGRLNILLNKEFPGRVAINLETIQEFIDVHGEPDEYSGGVIGACTGITDRLEPSKEALADARRILSKL